jgi:hypothetical protein
MRRHRQVVRDPADVRLAPIAKLWLAVARRGAGAPLPGRVEERTRAVAGRTGGACCERRPFVAALAEKPIAPSLVPAHRTGRDHFGHPARTGFTSGIRRRAAEVGQEPERLVPQIRRRRGTADSQARPARAGVGESGAQNDTDTGAPFIDSVERVRQTQLRDPRAAGEALQRQRAELEALVARGRFARSSRLSRHVGDSSSDLRYAPRRRSSARDG